MTTFRYTMDYTLRDVRNKKNIDYGRFEMTAANGFEVKNAIRRMLIGKHPELPTDTDWFSRNAKKIRLDVHTIFVGEAKND